MRTLLGHRGWVGCSVFSSDDSLLATCSWDGSAKVSSLETLDKVIFPPNENLESLLKGGA